jgi:nucleotide-binding universal stress UspA family protein
MRWITGIDLRPLCVGAIHFCAWLARESRAPDGERFVPVHVLEDEHLRFVLRLHHLDEVVGAARAAARAALAPAEAPAAFEPPDIVVGGSAADRLAEAARAQGAAGIVIGRVARREAHGLVRLGAVARALLRDLPGPVIVVPPDVRPGEGDGPIVALTALHQDSPACAFAQEIARRTGRPLEVVHVVPAGDDVGYLVRSTLDEIGRVRRAEAERSLEGWLRTHGLAPASGRVLEGSLLEAALAFCRARAAALVVVGTRRTGAHPERWGAGLSREIAANAPVAVAVVPG